MGIETATYRQIRHGGYNGTSPKDILCLGYPDLLVEPDQLFSPYEEVPNADEVREWHGWEGPIYETTEVFRKEFQAETDCVDIIAHRGFEKVHDLNFPVDWDKEYDMVIDGGTAEHCFNIAQVFVNILTALRRDGGTIIHVNPLNMINHGFWNISPTAYTDFYEANGLRVVTGVGIGGPKNMRKVMPYTDQHYYARFMAEVEVTNSVVVHGKGRDADEIVWPMQRKYR